MEEMTSSEIEAVWSHAATCDCDLCERFVPTLPVDLVTPAAAEEIIVDSETGGRKGQKLERYDLLPFVALDEVARVYGKGSMKYEDNNWRKGYRWSLSAGALMRHFSLFMQRVDRDEGPRGTGCLHIAAVAWHALALTTFQLLGLGKDDRP